MLNEQHSGSFGNDSELVIFRTEAFKCVLPNNDNTLWSLCLVRMVQ